VECTNLLVGIHAGETAVLGTSLTTLGSDVLHLLLGAVGEVTGVGVVGHLEECLIVEGSVVMLE